MQHACRDKIPKFSAAVLLPDIFVLLWPVVLVSQSSFRVVALAATCSGLKLNYGTYLISPC